MNQVIKIGTTIRARGFEFQVIANEESSYYGYCPEGCVIGRNRAGSTIISNSELEIVN